MTQLELSTQQTSVIGDNVSTVLRTLINEGWMKAKRLSEFTSLDERSIREAAHDSGGRILSGQRGYIRSDEASADEISHAANWLEHQANEMSKRALEIRRFADGGTR